jgi:pimeloyl-ACP methyl ester carboxylesterase
MFSPDCDSNIVAEMTKRALAIEPTFGMSLLADIGRHDSEKMERILRGTTVPVLAIQSTYITKNGQRNQLAGSQASPYLNLLRSTVSNLTVDIVTDSGHYPQIEQPEKVNKALSKFLAASTPR